MSAIDWMQILTLQTLVSQNTPVLQVCSHLDWLSADLEANPNPKVPTRLPAAQVCSHLDRLSADLEAAAHPALDDLTAKVSTANLERVRRIKNRLVRLTTRVETLREVLEKILDDDSDMHQMNLTARAMDLLERQARDMDSNVGFRV